MTERPENPELAPAAAYALGILSPEEARSFERVLASSEAARREVAEFREVAGLLALQAPDAVPDPDLRDKVMARIGQEKATTIPKVQPLPRPSPLPWLAAAAAAILALGLGWSLILSRKQVDARDEAIASLKTELTARQERLDVQERTLAAVLGPGVRLTVLVSASKPEPAVQLFVNRRRGIAIAQAIGLPAVAPGRAYQLWFIPKSGKPIASATFTPGDSASVLVTNIAVPPGRELTAAAITEEPAGGSDQPTSPVLLSGAL